VTSSSPRIAQPTAGSAMPPCRISRNAGRASTISATLPVMNTGLRPQRSDVRPTSVIVSTTSSIVPSTRSCAVVSPMPTVEVM
jgi:hypothetical protein